MKGKSPETTPPQKRSRTSFLARSPLFPGVMLADLSPSTGMPACLPSFQEWKEILSFRTPAARCSPPQTFSCSSHVPDKALLLDKKLAGKFRRQLLPNITGPVQCFPGEQRVPDARLGDHGPTTAHPFCPQEPSQEWTLGQVSHGWMELGGGAGGRGAHAALEPRLKRDLLSTLCSLQRQPGLQWTRGKPSCSQALSGPSPVKLGLSVGPLFPGGAPHSCRKVGGGRERLTVVAKGLFSIGPNHPGSRIPTFLVPPERTERGACFLAALRTKATPRGLDEASWPEAGWGRPGPFWACRGSHRVSPQASGDQAWSF